MRRPRRRPSYYKSVCLYDGTVLAAFPTRKPSARILKRDGQRIDADNVCMEFPGSGLQIGDWKNETRFRFQDILANALNVRRAIRSLVLLRLDALGDQLGALRAQLDRVERLLAESVLHEKSQHPKAK